MGLPGVGRPVRVVRESEPAREPVELPDGEPEREKVPVEQPDREPVKV